MHWRLPSNGPTMAEITLIRPAELEAVCRTPLRVHFEATLPTFSQACWGVWVVRSTSLTPTGSTGVEDTATARASTATMDLNCILGEGFRSVGLGPRSQVVCEDWLKALIAEEALLLGVMVMRREDVGWRLCLYRFVEVGGPLSTAACSKPSTYDGVLWWCPEWGGLNSDRHLLNQGSIIRSPLGRPRAERLILHHRHILQRQLSQEARWRIGECTA